MDLCSLDDAFPNINTGSPFVGGTDAYSTKEERRAARKKAKKCKRPLPETMMDPDPDRPAVIRTDEVSSLQAEKEEGFALPKASCLFSNPGYPSYFGKGEDDEEGFAAYSGIDVTAEENPIPVPQLDALSSFSLKGAAKAAGEGLPAPNMNDRWKPMTPTGSTTAFLSEEAELPSLDSLPAAISMLPGWSKKAIPELLAPTATTVTGENAQVKTLPPPPAFLGDVEKREIYQRIDQLTAQLAALEEKRRESVKATQTETLAIIGSGIVLLVVLDMVSRL